MSTAPPPSRSAQIPEAILRRAIEHLWDADRRPGPRRGYASTRQPTTCDGGCGTQFGRTTPHHTVELKVKGVSSSPDDDPCVFRPGDQVLAHLCPECTPPGLALA